MTTYKWTKLNEYPDSPTCERCWHAIATWFGGIYRRYLCDKCKQRDQSHEDNNFDGEDQ